MLSIEARVSLGEIRSVFDIDWLRRYHARRMKNDRHDFSNIQLFIFDLDGTLIDSKLDLALSVNATRTFLQLPPLTHELIFSFIGDGARQLIQRALDHSEDDADVDRALRFFLEYYRAHMFDHTVLYPGVRKAIEELYGKGKILTILTNKPVRFSRMIMEGLGVAEKFKSIYGGNSFEKKKPDPMGVNYILEENRLQPLHALMVGDSDVDVITARNAGLRSVGVTYGLGAEKMKSTPPDLLIHDLRELTKLLNPLC